MPRLSVFPKCYMDALCVTKTMTLFEWIDLAATLDVDGVEMYPGFFESFEPAYLERVRAHLARVGLEAPMMCASPDFTQPDAEARQAEVERERHMIDVTAALGGRYCRVLSGQRREEVSRANGVRWTVECITSVLDTAVITCVPIGWPGLRMVTGTSIASNISPPSGSRSCVLRRT